MISSLAQDAVFTSPRDSWRKAAYYQPHLEYDCVKWAGEWLWRNPDFLADWHRAPCRIYEQQARIVTCSEHCPMTKWGLRCCRISDGAPAFLWLPDVNPHVLVVEVESTKETDNTVDLRQCTLLSTALCGSEQELNLLFNDSGRTLQVVLRGTSSLEGRFFPRCTLQGTHQFETKPLSLRRLCCLYKKGRLAKSLYPGERRSKHWINMLRAHDGVQAGAPYREICAVIYGEWAAEDGWNTSYRSRVQRLVRSARRMINGGYLKLLL